MQTRFSMPFSAPRTRLHIRAALLCLAAIVLGGCASAPTTRLAPTQLRFPLRVLAVQAPMAVDAERMRQVLAPDAKRALPDERFELAAQHAQARASAVMASALGAQRDVIAVSPAAAQEAALPIRKLDFESSITPDEAARLRAATGADAVLRYRITDYGLTPVAWRRGYIAFEVTTTLAIAAVIAYSKSVAAKAAAGAYLVQETAEETAEAYAGSEALDKVCRPVRIEAKLVGLNPHVILWQTSNTGFSDIQLTRVFRKVDEGERDKQLDEATDNAVKGVISDLSHALEYSPRRAQ